MTAQPENVPLKCVVEEQANGKKCCKTHGYELEPVRSLTGGGIAV
jgi:hypothetical protein